MEQGMGLGTCRMGQELWGQLQCRKTECRAEDCQGELAQKHFCSPGTVQDEQGPCKLPQSHNRKQEQDTLGPEPKPKRPECTFISSWNGHCLLHRKKRSEVKTSVTTGQTGRVGEHMASAQPMHPQSLSPASDRLPGRPAHQIRGPRSPRGLHSPRGPDLLHCLLATAPITWQQHLNFLRELHPHTSDSALSSDMCVSQACSADPEASAPELRTGMLVGSNLVQKDLISEHLPELPGKGVYFPSGPKLITSKA